jgi:hypothetical protein
VAINLKRFSQSEDERELNLSSGRKILYTSIKLMRVSVVLSSNLPEWLPAEVWGKTVVEPTEGAGG